MSDHGPFDGVELKQWAEMYGHPEEWAKRAQAAHGCAERAEAECERLRYLARWIRTRSEHRLLMGAKDTVLETAINRVLQGGSISEGTGVKP